MSEIRGKRAFIVEAEYIVRRPEGVERPPVLLLLHGFGESAERIAARFDGLAPEGVATVFPGAPLPVEIGPAPGASGGAGDGERRRIGQAWYAYDGDQERFRESLEEAEAYLESLLEDLAKKAGLDAERVVVAGYSMGAYVAGFFALRRKPLPLGLGLLAGRLKHEFLEREIERAKGLPVFIGYGEKDERLPLPALAEGRRQLEAAGAKVTVFTHGAGHALNPDLAGALARWAATAFKR